MENTIIEQIITEKIADHISIQGFSHKKIGKECQDHSVSWKTNDYAAIIVCDGHGGDKYIRSAIGSALACQVGKEMISCFMEAVPHSTHRFEDDLIRLENSIVSLWRTRVCEDFTISPVESDERFASLQEDEKSALTKNPVKAYGSTFLAAVLAENYAFILKLGDGNALFFSSDGSVIQPDELFDEDLQFNVTTSLCNSDAAVSFHHCYRKNTDEKFVKGITLTSDGVINCYHTEKAYTALMENIFNAYGEEDAENARAELAPVLDSLSERGSGDDLSVAVVRLPLTEEERRAIEKIPETTDADNSERASRKHYVKEKIRPFSKDAAMLRRIKMQKDNFRE